MDELLKQALEKYFADLKDYHLVILISCVIIIALIQVIQSIWVSKKLEAFKNDLKKSEIKFSRFNQLQVTALRTIYHKLAEFQGANTLLFNSKPNTVGHKIYMDRINNWVRQYIECANELAKEKILLTLDLKDLFSKTLEDFEQVKKVLITEKNDLTELEMQFDENWNAMYNYPEKELESISRRIENLKTTKPIINLDKHIRELRELIEELFLKMN